MSCPEFIEEDVPLGPLTTLEVGGLARYFAPCHSLAELRRALQWANDEGHPVFMLGSGSNVVVADAGFDGLVISYLADRIRFDNSADAADVQADAGADWDPLVRQCVDEKLAGIECLSGIPGRVGATPIQNIGAYGQEVAATIQSVSGIDTVSMNEQLVPADECGFGYRSSHFKTRWKSFIVTAVHYRLARKDAGQVAYDDLRRALGIDDQSSVSPTLAETRDAVIRVRRDKSMVISADDPNRRSAGSFFMNPVLSQADYDAMIYRLRLNEISETPPSYPAPGGARKVPAAWLIERAGFGRGYIDGRVGLSTRHTLAVINRGGACASDIIRFAAAIRHVVQSKFGVSLTAEPVFIGFRKSADELLSWL